MGKYCIFCGQELGLLQRKSLWCGGTSQCTCNDCYQKYVSYNSVERAELALRTGRAENAVELQEYVDRVHAAKEEREARQAEKIQQRATDKKCLRCGGRMIQYGPLMLKLGEETYFLSDLNRLLSGSLQVEILRCEACGKAEFYIPDVEGLESVTEEA